MPFRKEIVENYSPPSSPGEHLLHQDGGSRIVAGSAQPVLGLSIQFLTQIFFYLAAWVNFLFLRDWGGELAFPLPHNTSTPRSWLQDEEEVRWKNENKNTRRKKITNTSWLWDEEDFWCWTWWALSSGGKLVGRRQSAELLIFFLSFLVFVLICWALSCGGKLVGRRQPGEWVDTNLTPAHSPGGQLQYYCSIVVLLSPGSQLLTTVLLYYCHPVANYQLQ